MPERLQKILSQWGIASRRQAEELIISGAVRVNGQTAQLGQTADPSLDSIEVQGKKLQTHTRPGQYYLLINKPLGMVSTCDDPQGRPTVLDLLPLSFRNNQGIHPVGRLDQNTTGALLLTNDGNLTYRLTHPKHQITKTYYAWIKGTPSLQTLHQWRTGVILDGQMTLPAQIATLAPTPAFPVKRPPYHSTLTCIEIVMVEGRNRQIRRVAQQLGHPVVHLHRFKIGNIGLGDHLQDSVLANSHWRHLNPSEVSYLVNA